MLKEFREFAVKGNMLDLAIGVIIGGAFGKIITSLVEDIIMPPIGLLLGKMDFSSLFLNMSGQPAASLADAKKAGLAVLAYGQFLNTVINFLIVALCVFFVVKAINRLRREPAQAPDTQECPFCASAISVKATRCPNCTSQLNEAVAGTP